MTSGDRWVGVAMFILIILAVNWVAGIRLRSRQAANVHPSLRRAANVLQYPRNILYRGVATCAVFAAVVFAGLFSHKDLGVLFYLVFIGFALVGVYTIAAYYRVWFEFDWRGMSYQRVFGGRGTLRWPEVTRIDYSRKGGGFFIKTSDRRLIKLDNELMGLPELAGTVLEEVPRSSMDERTWENLEALAAQA